MKNMFDDGFWIIQKLIPTWWGYFIFSKNKDFNQKMNIYKR